LLRLAGRSLRRPARNVLQRRRRRSTWD